MALLAPPCAAKPTAGWGGGRGCSACSGGASGGSKWLVWKMDDALQRKLRGWCAKLIAPIMDHDFPDPTDEGEERTNPLC